MFRFHAHSTFELNCMHCLFKLVYSELMPKFRCRNAGGVRCGNLRRGHSAQGAFHRVARVYSSEMLKPRPLRGCELCWPDRGTQVAVISLVGQACLQTPMVAMQVVLIVTKQLMQSDCTFRNTGTVLRANRKKNRLCV